MAITSYGYQGTIAPNDVWAEMQWGLGLRYWVYSQTQCQVSGLSGGANQIQVSNGNMGAWGVFDKITSPEVVTLPTAVTGSRYFVIWATRTWGSTQSTAITYSDMGTALPASYGVRNNDWGEIDDQPLALVKVTAGQSVPQVIYDLRCVGGAHFYEIYADIPNLNFIAYLAQIGYRVKVGNIMYTRTVNQSTGNAIWDADPTTIRSGPGLGNALGVTGYAGWNTTSEFICSGVKSGPHRQLNLTARRSGPTLTFSPTGHLVDELVLQVSNSDFHPAARIPVPIQFTNAGRFNCDGLFTSSGDLTILSGPPNVSIPQQATGDYSITTQISWIAS